MEKYFTKEREQVFRKNDIAYQIFWGSEVAQNIFLKG